MNIAVLDAATLALDASEWDFLQTFGNPTLHQRTPHSRDAVVERAADAEVVLTNKVPLDAETLAALPRLRMIGVLATGYNVIDLEAAKARGIAVCNVPAYSTGSVAQHTIALILELLHRVGEHSASVHAGDWVRAPDFSYWRQPVIELSGLTVGIVGFGTIGRRVGQILDAFGATILASARTPRDAPAWPGFAWADTDEIFRRADIVTLHCPQTPANFQFVNAGLLATMKPTAGIVNTARGTLIDEVALAAALRDEIIAGAALDVVSQEPMIADNPLLGVKNAILTPHMAWCSLPSRRRLLGITAENIRGFLAGDAPNRVA